MGQFPQLTLVWLSPQVPVQMNYHIDVGEEVKKKKKTKSVIEKEKKKGNDVGWSGSPYESPEVCKVE